MDCRFYDTSRCLNSERYRLLHQKIRLDTSFLRISAVVHLKHQYSFCSLQTSESYCHLRLSVLRIPETLEQPQKLPRRTKIRPLRQQAQSFLPYHRRGTQKFSRPDLRAGIARYISRRSPSSSHTITCCLDVAGVTSSGCSSPSS